VPGASEGNLWELLSKEFVLPVLFSCIIATPIACYYLNNWLNNNDYRVTLNGR
jgi:hypothetical protein